MDNRDRIGIASSDGLTEYIRIVSGFINVLVETDKSSQEDSFMCPECIFW
jgi:hypothetical protein